MLPCMNHFMYRVNAFHTNHVIGITVRKVSAYPHILYRFPTRRALFLISEYRERSLFPFLSHPRFLYFSNHNRRVIRPTGYSQRLAIRKDFRPCRLAGPSETCSVQGHQLHPVFLEVKLSYQTCGQKRIAQAEVTGKITDRITFLLFLRNNFI